VRADDPGLARFKSIARELCGRLAHLEPDKRYAVNVVAWSKRPGTIDTKTGREVVYSLLGGEGIPERYKLDELARLLDLELARPLPAIRAYTARSRELKLKAVTTREPLALAAPGELEPARFTHRGDRRGYGQAQGIYLDLVDIVNGCGLIPEGKRYAFLWLWFCALAVLRGEAVALADTARVAVSRCERGADKLAEVERFKIKKPRDRSWTHAGLGDWASVLGVTAELAASLGLRELVPLEVRTLRADEREARTWAKLIHYQDARIVAGAMLKYNPAGGDEQIAAEVAKSLRGPCSRGLVKNVRRELGIKPNRKGNPRRRPRG